MPPRRTILRAPFLKRIWLDRDRPFDPQQYPFCLPLFRNGDFELSFTNPITIIIGENGTGKSTLLETIAALIGFDQSGGGVGYRPVDHSRSLEKSGEEASRLFRASWLPKVTAGWFFKAETFFSVARYLDVAALDAHEAPPDFLSHSHGEGFLRFFEERLRNKGIYIFDEPESALSPARQIELMKILKRVRREGQGQIIMATHSPLLMAFPGAELLEIKRDRLEPTELRDTSHYSIYRSFLEAPELFIDEQLEDKGYEERNLFSD
jgi:predicted ATPase